LRSAAAHAAGYYLGKAEVCQGVAIPLSRNVCRIALQIADHSRAAAKSKPAASGAARPKFRRKRTSQHFKQK